MLGVYGLLFVRDKENEPIEKTMENGYNCYKDKYNDLPTVMECSLKDFDHEFEYLTARVYPSKLLSKGNIWITGKYFEGYKSA